VRRVAPSIVARCRDAAHDAHTDHTTPAPPVPRAAPDHSASHSVAMALATAPPAGNVADALAYVREVRDRFARQTGKYREFLAAMRDFKTGTCVATKTRRDATRPTRDDAHGDG